MGYSLIWLWLRFLTRCLVLKCNIHLILCLIDWITPCKGAMLTYPCCCHFSFHCNDLHFLKVTYLCRHLSISLVLHRFLAFHSKWFNLIWRLLNSPKQKFKIAHDLVDYWFQHIQLHGHVCLSIQITLDRGPYLSSQARLDDFIPKTYPFLQASNHLKFFTHNNNSNYCKLI